MPSMNIFRTNQFLLDEILRRKELETKQYVLPHKKPSSVTTIEPIEKLNVVEWFEFLYSRKDRKVYLDM